MRYYRTKFENATYHITTRCNNKELLFNEDGDFSYYLKTLSEHKKRLNFLLHNYTVMHNHTHLLIKPIGDTGISEIMQAINRQYARWYNASHARNGHFWESRFDSVVIADDQQLLAVMRYIDLNAVRAGLCNDPSDWTYSGAAYYSTGKANHLLDMPDTYITLGSTIEQRRSAYRSILAINI